MPRRTRRTARVVHNPVRDEYVDSLTGERVTALAVGAAPTGQRFIRLRPRPGAPLQAVVVHRDDVDERRATYGLDRGTRAYYQEQAAKKAKAEKRLRAARPLGRDDELVLAQLGIPTTFTSARKGAEEFIAQNTTLFGAPEMDDADVGDVTRDFMDRLEVRRRGGRHVPLSKTARGREILGGGKGGSRTGFGDVQTALAGSSVVREMLVYLFGKSGSGRRYADVPWDAVEDYLSEVWNAAHGGGAAQAGSGAPIEWWPLASGQLGEEDAELLVHVVDQYGARKAQKIADYHTSRRLHSMANALDRLLSPSKGAQGKEDRATLRCIPAEHRKLIRHRARVLRDWARYPEQIPEWSCVPKEWGSHEVFVCTFPALEKDVDLILRACEEPYDPEWPTKLRRQYASEGRLDAASLHGTGVMPIDTDPAAQPAFAVGAAPESLSLPWEAAANPGRRPMNLQHMRRRLVKR